ncbi:MAG: DUF4199 domain-containing protein [Flavobacteriaceae bacterium]|nr:DUF4199 domain-containing protein [Flavobacteriaceae bacterium]
MSKIFLPIRYGLAITGLLIAYFLFLALFDFHTNPVFSFFNAVITAFGIYSAIKVYKLEQGKDFTYYKGFTIGIITGFISTILFTAFFLIYATEINPDFLTALLEVFKRDYEVKIGLVAFVVALMGLATTVVVTLACMQYFKQSWNIPQKQ